MTIICCCVEKMESERGSPSFVQLTIVTVPPVDIQVKVLETTLYSIGKSMFGMPACKYMYVVL